MKVAFCVAGLLLLLFTVEATSKQRNFISRQRRSLSWLPTFLGGSKNSDTENVTEDLSSASDEPAIEPNDGSKHVNGQLYYPIWRLHSYDGVNFQPIPLSFLPNGPLVHQPFTPTDNRKQQQSFNLPINVLDKQTSLNSGASGNAPNAQANEYPQELVDLAREYGLTDISKFPSLEEIGDLLGTTTQKDTIEAIKDLVSTQEGRDLIQQYISNGEDNEVAASETDENVENGEAQLAESVDDEEIKPAETNLFSNYALHNGNPQHSLLTQNPIFGQTQRKQYDTKSVDEVETTTPATSYSDRIFQWANFLNPATNRQEIPIPISDLESNKDSNIVKKISTASVNSNSLSPVQYIPVIYENGQYFLANVPLASLNRPSPQLRIDQKYNSYAGIQRQPPSSTENKPLSDHMPSVESEISTDPVNRKSIQVNNRVATTTNRNPVQFVYQLPAKTTKQTYWKPPGPSRMVFSNIPQGIQLPLSNKANYEILRNGPRLETSYGTPVLSYSNSGLNAMHVSPLQPSAASTHQDYDLRPAASETVERTLSSNSQISSNDELCGNEDVANKQDIFSRNQETVELSNNEQKSVQVESHKNDSNAYGNKADVNTEVISTEKSVQETFMSTEKNIRHDLNEITVDNNKNTRTHIQRITPHDKPATGKIYRADPKAMDMLPFTVRRMTKAQEKSNNNK